MLLQQFSLEVLAYLASWQKNHDFDFTIDGYDAEGRKVAMQFKFKNNKPVKKLTSELYRISGLAMVKWVPFIGQI